MTEPGEIPVYTSLRWSRVGCTVCGVEQTALMASGWIDAALAYTRVEFP